MKEETEGEAEQKDKNDYIKHTRSRTRRKMENGQEFLTECAQCLRSESSDWIVACTIELKFYEREKTIRRKKIWNIGLCFPR